MKSKNTTTVLWGVKKGEPEWAEQVLSTNPKRFAEIKKLAARDGFGRFRTAVIDLDVPPDFAKTINTK